MFIKLFDSKVQPVAQYGAELWGLDQSAQYCESVHLYALKRFLGVDRRTPNDMVYGETGRYPIVINASIKCIKYWFKLISMHESRLPYKSYIMLRLLDEKGCNNWVTKIRQCLFMNGFGIVWYSQGVGDVAAFINCFRQRLVDCNWQNWYSHIHNSERFIMYSSFNGISHDIKPYLLLDVDRHLKRTMTKFRFGVSDITVHR